MTVKETKQCISGITDMSEVKTIKHLWILAGSQREAQTFARERGLNPNDWSYIASVQSLRTYYHIPYVRVGSWESRKDIVAINRGLDAIGAIEGGVIEQGRI